MPTVEEAKQFLALQKTAQSLASVQAKQDILKFCQVLHFKPYPWQIKFLQSQSKRVLVNCCRQSGKSTICALRALWRAIFFPGSLILIVSPTQPQSFELLRKVQLHLRYLTGVVTPPIEKDNSSTLEFANGSRIVSLPGHNEENIRGYSGPSEIFVDEAGDVTDDIYRAVIPMLAKSKGTLVVAGTPKGQRGTFFNWWSADDLYYDRIQADWRMCPWITDEEIARVRIELGEQFPAEMECQFLRLSGGMIYPAFTNQANVVFKLPDSPTWTYLLAIDFGYVDATAFVVFGWRPHDKALYVVASYQKSGMVADDIAKYAKQLHTTYPYFTIIGDVGGYGKGPAMELGARYDLHVEPAPKVDKAGYINIMNSAFAMKQLQILSSNAELIDELLKLPWNNARTDSMAGFTDHLSDATLYGFRVATAYLAEPAKEKPKNDDQRIREEMKEYWKAAEEEQASANNRNDLMESLLGEEV